MPWGAPLLCPGGPLPVSWGGLSLCPGGPLPCVLGVPFPVSWGAPCLCPGEPFPASWGGPALCRLQSEYAVIPHTTELIILLWYAGRCQIPSAFPDCQHDHLHLIPTRHSQAPARGQRCSSSAAWHPAECPATPASDLFSHP